MNITEKIEKVKEILRDKKIVIAFSGGSDSTLLGYLAKKVSKDVLAITVDNYLFDEKFLDNSKKIAANLGIKQIILEEDFYKQPHIIKNDSKRCFYCRKIMYSKIINKAKEEEFDFIVDGNNISDLVKDRPGIVVTLENNIITPLIEAKIESYEVHNYLKKHKIDYCESTTCLATRFEEEITKKRINKINTLEKIIYDNSNCNIVKVRVFNDEYVVESENISELKNERVFNLINDEVNKKFDKEINFKLVEIEKNDRIILNEKEDYFNYKLPYQINIEKTKENLFNRIDYLSENVIILKEKITIRKNGLISAKTITKEEFIELLSHIHRK